VFFFHWLLSGAFAIAGTQIINGKRDLWPCVQRQASDESSCAVEKPFEKRDNH